MRSLLTALGIIIGIASVITMVSLGEGAQASIASNLSGLGTQVVSVSPGQQIQGGVDRGSAMLTTTDAEALLRDQQVIRAVGRAHLHPPCRRHSFGSWASIASAPSPYRRRAITR